MADIGIPESPAVRGARYAVYNEDGTFSIIVQCVNDAVADQCVGPGQYWVKDVENPESKRFVDGELVEHRGESPGEDYEWNVARGTWVLSAAAVQRAQAQLYIDIQELTSLRAMREWILTKDEKAFTRLLDLDESIQKSRRTRGP